MDKLTIRKATTDDKEAILDIHTNVFDGRDYLPSYFDHFLTCPGTMAAVGQHEGRIIAYEVGQIIDNGETVISRGGRVNSNFGGKGVIIRLSRYVYEWGLSEGVKGNVLAVSDGYPYLANPSFKERTKLILTKQYPWYWIAGQGLIFTDTDIKDASQLPTISDSHLSHYFKSKAVRDYIAPEGRMLVDVVPYKMIDANIPFIMQPRQYMKAYSDIKQSGEMCSGLLSFGMLFPIAQPQYKYMLDIFGTDYQSLRGHIVKHLVRLKSETTGVTAMLIYVSDKINVEKVDGIMKDFGISRHPHESKLKSRQVYALDGVPEVPSKL